MNKEKTKLEISKLQKLLRIEIIRTINTQSVEAQSKLESIIEYINAGLSSTLENKQDCRSQIGQIEKDVYVITDKIEKIDEEAPGVYIYNLHNDLNRVRKQCSSIQTNLEKLGGEENKKLAQNVEELQSIIGDLSFSFQEKIEGRNDLGELFSKTYDHVTSSLKAKEQEKKNDQIFDL